MSLVGISLVLVVLLTTLLAGGVWIGVALLATGWAGMQFAPGGIPAGGPAGRMPGGGIPGPGGR